MKYLFFLTTFFTALFSYAQQSKPNFNYPTNTNYQTITDTSKGLSSSKWAQIAMYKITDKYLGKYVGILSVYFDNGSCINLIPIFDADPKLLRNNHIYYMAALEYMDKLGFRLIDSYSGESILGNVSTFQRK
jgi:hypothetical protein